MAFQADWDSDDFYASWGSYWGFQNRDVSMIQTAFPIHRYNGHFYGVAQRTKIYDFTTNEVVYNAQEHATWTARQLRPVFIGRYCYLAWDSLNELDPTSGNVANYISKVNLSTGVGETLYTYSVAHTTGAGTIAPCWDSDGKLYFGLYTYDGTATYVSILQVDPSDDSTELFLDESATFTISGQTATTNLALVFGTIGADEYIFYVNPCLTNPNLGQVRKIKISDKSDSSVKSDTVYSYPWTGNLYGNGYIASRLTNRDEDIFWTPWSGRAVFPSHNYLLDSTSSLYFLGIDDGSGLYTSAVTSSSVNSLSGYNLGGAYIYKIDPTTSGAVELVVTLNSGTDTANRGAGYPRILPGTEVNGRRKREFLLRAGSYLMGIQLPWNDVL